MTIENYERTYQQNENLGLNDMKVEGYEQDHLVSPNIPTISEEEPEDEVNVRLLAEDSHVINMSNGSKSLSHDVSGNEGDRQ